MKQATTLHTKINTRGRDEQERAYLFDGLYNTAHRLTKAERGAWLQIANRIKSNNLQTFFN